MKRALLIAGGTVGGLGAVLAITPPQFTSSQTLNVAGGGLSNPSGNSATTAAPASTQSNTATKSATATSTTKQSAAATKASTSKNAVVKSTKNNSSAAVTTGAAQSTTQSQSPTPAVTQTQAAPAPAQTSAAPTKSLSSGTFTGPVVNVSYGDVQVQITVSNGKITDATALQAPSGRNDRYTSFAIPILRKQTLAAQSDAIQGASGASYTSYGWFKSLQGALAKAGL